MPVVDLSDEDYAAYVQYVTLPPAVQWTIRVMVYLARSDQRIVQRVVAIICRVSGEVPPRPSRRPPGRLQSLSRPRLAALRQSIRPADRPAA